MTAVGIFGGTFAPIHHGHLRLAIELRERLRLDRVHLIPAGEPPHREAPGVSALRRLDWVRRACAGEPGLVVDDREVRRGGRSYTYDTLASLRAELPDASLVLLLGDDAANQFHSWHRWREIPQLAHLVFVDRPYEPPAQAPVTVSERSEVGADAGLTSASRTRLPTQGPVSALAPELLALMRGRRATNAEQLHAQPAGLFMSTAVPPLAISSTRVRSLLKARRSVRGLVPQAVIDSFTAEDINALTHDEDSAQD